MAKPIGTLGTIDTLTIGGRVFTDLTTMKILSTSGSGATNVRGTFRLLTASSGYAVTALKTLTIHAAQVVVTSGTFVTLAYSDNDVGFQSSTAFTNPVYMLGTLSAYLMGSSYTASLPGPFQMGGINWQIPAGKYPGVFNQGSGEGLTYIYGYET